MIPALSPSHFDNHAAQLERLEYLRKTVDHDVARPNVKKLELSEAEKMLKVLQARADLHGRRKRSG